MNDSDQRLSFKPYRQMLESVQTQFDLLRFSLNSLKPIDRKRFFKGIAGTKLAQIEKFRLIAKKEKLMPDEEVDQLAQDQIKVLESDTRRANRAGNPHALSEFTEDRLNQSELLLLVAHFESFMKLVHERFLCAAPSRVFATGFRDDQNPRIPIKDIFDPSQSSWNSQKFLRELVAKEVKWLDAQGIETKAEYFAKHFGVQFCSPDEIKELVSIMRRRNQISHEIYEPPKNQEQMLKETLEHGKQQPLVDTPMLKKARHFFYWIPQKCIEHGGKTHQSYFKHY